MQNDLKNRNIPYGYNYDNGELVIDKKESVIVLEIFNAYLAGKSLGQLSNVLMERRVEYSPGITDWNKPRVKRIIEDERYIGKNQFPPIISAEIYAKAQDIRMQKNTKKAIDITMDIYRVSVPVKCPKCNGKMVRRYERMCKRKERWICQREGCRTVLVKSDKELLEGLGDLIKRLNGNPELIQTKEQVENEESMELRALKNDIEQRLNNINIDEKKTRQLMLDYASLQYTELDTNTARTQRLKDIFRTAKVEGELLIELLNRTVREIVLGLDGEIQLMLLNNQKIKQEK